MSKRSRWLAALVVLAPISPDYAGESWEFDVCGSFSGDCYHLEGPKWCQRQCTWYDCWTPVNVYNHTSIWQINNAWDNFNYPPSGPANSLYLYSDGVNNWSHDVDYNAFWSPYTNERAYVSWTSSYSCFYRESGYAEINTFYLTGHYAYRLAHHTTGHGTGLNENCNCHHVMNPWFDCDLSDIITECDADGVRFLYP